MTEEEDVEDGATQTGTNVISKNVNVILECSQIVF